MAKFCTNCGATLPDDKNFCTECGTLVATVEPTPVVNQEPVVEPAMETPPVQTAPPPVQQTPPPTQTTPPPVQTVYQYSTAPAGETIPPKGSKYDPITTGGYIGIMLLMCIPVVGLILMIVWAFGGAKKINKRNLARASLIMMAIGLVFSLIFGFIAKAVVNKAVEAVGFDNNTIGNIISGEAYNETSEEENALNALGALSALAGLTSDGEDTNVDQNITNSDIEELEALSDVLGSLEALTGGASESDEDGQGASLSELADNAADINRKAEEANDGWPKSLRAYPGGTATAVASYRTVISDTTLDEMLAWIEDLKKDGYEFQDFYDFGMTEEDMLSMNGWWATDGEIYLSVSYYDGLVTIDHTKELPDLSDLF